MAASCGGLKARYARVSEATGVLPANLKKNPHPPWITLTVAGAGVAGYGAWVVWGRESREHWRDSAQRAARAR